jgi:hypothetical protein
MKLLDKIGDAFIKWYVHVWEKIEEDRLQNLANKELKKRRYQK